MTLTAQPVATPEVLLDAKEKTRLLLADLWRRNRPVIEERLGVLDRAAAGPLSGDLHGAALDVAHKLSGSLGMFGFDRGTVLARELEELLGAPEPDTCRLGELARQLREMLLPAS
jgi:HPt (histidine-containing phosphotransfer) domain-containing protein